MNLITPPLTVLFAADYGGKVLHAPEVGIVQPVYPGSWCNRLGSVYRVNSAVLTVLPLTVVFSPYTSATYPVMVLFFDQGVGGTAVHHHSRVFIAVEAVPEMLTYSTRPVQLVFQIDAAAMGDVPFSMPML